MLQYRVPGLWVEEIPVAEAPSFLSADRFRDRLDRWTPFHEPAYVSLWEQTLGPRNGGRIVVAWDGTGGLAAYAPLMRVRGRVGLVPVPTLRFIGNNIGGQGDILHADIPSTPNERSAIRAILGHVASDWLVGKWDLGFVSPSSPTWRAASEILGDGIAAPAALESVPFVSVRLPTEWGSYIDSLTSNTRSSYRRGLRHLDSLGPLRVVVDTSPEAAPRRVEELIANHIRWLAGTEREGWFPDGAVRRFLVSSFELLARQRQFLSATLELDDEPIAWIIGAVHGTTSFEQISSYDRTYSEDSPGLVLGLELMREMISRGFRRVELGPGSTLYKKRLGGEEKPYRRFIGYQRWTRGAAWAQSLLKGSPAPFPRSLPIRRTEPRATAHPERMESAHRP